jgi:hypothetical protein
VAPASRSFLDNVVARDQRHLITNCRDGSLARDRFDSDCLLGTQFESSRPHHAFSFERRFPGSRRVVPNWRRCLARIVSATASLQPSKPFPPGCPALKIPFPGNGEFVFEETRSECVTIELEGQARPCCGEVGATFPLRRVSVQKYL